MDEILLTTICACICGAEGWQDIEDYGNAQIDFLRTLLPYKNGIPSDDRFRRFFRAIDPTEFQDQIGKIIAIDGKASRHSFDESQTMLHTVSAYATEARLVLVQEKATKLYGDSSVIERIEFERNYSHHRCDCTSAWILFL
jgi:hypothetical protein